MAVQVIVINGGSSSGKSGIVRCLKSILPQPWLSFGVDTLVEALPPTLSDAESGVAYGAAGEVLLGGQFLEIERAWTAGLATMARNGARIIIDDVFLSGSASQDRTRRLLDGLDVLWVGVHCDARIAAGRELARGDRIAGMAALQAEIVHRGVEYDIEVDTGRTESIDCAEAIAAAVALRDTAVATVRRDPVAPPY
ncbi:hypothetical protein GCM10027413_24910 [Conyzicola nivalis]|uniref:Chloramphenicol 3-O phosphotransferase n=1 Tax=Conyzicola nivalis TaxID=1477021 RepID=A0A916WEK3_9MICO|nr:chloramphenicol phosphotransferase CPT [Conyzicola nivalis]GGA90669.1 hypothetical protein GCM10010979_01710 [Conyzicola nivalis]